MKLCRKCGETKPFDEFHRAARYATGRQSYCKPCHLVIKREWGAANREKQRAEYRRNRIKGHYGLTVEEYEALLGGPCAICGVHRDKMYLDHDHRNGKVRAALCRGCNTSLGSMDEDPARLRAAAEYVEDWRRDHAGDHLHAGVA